MLEGVAVHCYCIVNVRNFLGPEFHDHPESVSNDGYEGIYARWAG